MDRAMPGVTWMMCNLLKTCGWRVMFVTKTSEDVTKPPTFAAKALSLPKLCGNGARENLDSLALAFAAIESRRTDKIVTVGEASHIVV